MKILSVECSAVPCSAVLSEDGKILASAFSNVKLTHSETLMPMVEWVLKSSLTQIGEIDALAVGVGPGSFTGVRIGISAVKGMAQPRKLPCIPVSTLEAMALNYRDTDCVVCAVMDARCNQLYNALFKNKDGIISRLCEDRALSIDDLIAEIEELSEKGENIIIVGDGAELFYSFAKEIKGVRLADSQHRFQNATGIAKAATLLAEFGKTVNSADLQPLYLRLPQAERELKRKEEQK